MRSRSHEVLLFSRLWSFSLGVVNSKLIPRLDDEAIAREASSTS